ncbi:RAMP superfamily CRISPR-associated protein [Porticoccaceae bacterium]|nr:RAMP superfamily CRISPR-associated protein [Porticoccaceae bacterium]
MIVINATITTKSPLSLSMPVAQGLNKNAYENFPLLVRGVDSKGEKKYTGYLPATTLRGFLRRSIVLADMNAAAEAGKPYKLKQAYIELIGQDAASEKESGDINLAALKKTREDSPVLDLFGAGLGLKSRLRVSHFLPPHNLLPEAITGARKDLDDNPDAFNLIAQEDTEQFYERSKGNTARTRAEAMLKTIKGQVRAKKRANQSTDELDVQLAEAEKLVDKYKDAMGDMKNSSRQIITHYALGSGIDLSGRLVVENPKERDIKMFEFALNSLSLFPILGANSARGCGEVSGVFEFIRAGTLFKKVTVGGFEPAVITDV